ncbi:MAG: ribonuclease Y [Planctomycetia bacterium]|nr:ribonuclease Y [Planctomycetia bacterium]
MHLVLFALAIDAIYVIIAVAVAVVASAGTIKFIDHLRKKDVETEAKNMLDRARAEIDSQRKESELAIKEQTIQQKADSEAELSKARQEVHERERHLDKREDSQEQQAEQLRKQERMVEASQRKLAEKIEDATRRNDELTKLLDLERQTLHQLSGLSRDEATRKLLDMLDQELTRQSGAIILKHERRLAEITEAKAREVLLTSIQRFAAAHTAESTTSSVDIPNDEMKGRIIGREGRNIRAFEKATGVDVLIDDTPGIVIVSAFDPVRREVARLSLNKLIADGRIHPGRIDEIAVETQREMEIHIQKQGAEAVQEAQVHGLHERLIHLLGRLKFRTSYSQNVLRHSIEVAFLSGQIAEELGMDGTLARRCGLLHDIGKAADHEAEGGHPKIGAELLKRYGERPEVVHAALGHHDDIRPEHPYTVIVAAADACSASRPGARRESLERYIKRMEELEKIACGFPGVQQAFAIQAGREVRVIASSRDTTDESAAKICRDIATAFEQQLTYPGEIKVTMIRETRMTETAK